MATIILVTDLPSAIQSNEMAATMVAGANAKASRVAPCLTWDGSDTTKTAPSEDQLAEARLVLIGAVKRWAETGSGALQAQTAGPFGMTVDTRQRTGYNLWPSEIEALQDICKAIGEGGRKAFSLDTAPSGGVSAHLPWCDLYFGGTDCSCGVDVAGYPIFELG